MLHGAHSLRLKEKVAQQIACCIVAGRLQTQKFGKGCRSHDTFEFIEETFLHGVEFGQVPGRITIGKAHNPLLLLKKATDGRGKWRFVGGRQCQVFHKRAYYACSGLVHIPYGRRFYEITEYITAFVAGFGQVYLGLQCGSAKE